MDDLLKKKCVPCEGGAIPFDISEIHNIGFINQVDITFIKKTNPILQKFQNHLEIWNKK